MQLGCQLLSPRCEADEISPEGVDGYYIEWEAELIAALLNKFQVPVKLVLRLFQCLNIEFLFQK